MTEDFAVGVVTGFGWGALVAIVAFAWVAHVVLTESDS